MQKKIKTVIVAGLPLYLLISACSNTTINRVARVKLQQLTRSEIYDENRVADVLFDAEELNTDSLKNKSYQLFLSGVDYFKNKKNAVEAILQFKKSILVLPNAKAYYELGNAIASMPLTVESYNETMNAYRVAKHLNFAPAPLLNYKMACATAAAPGHDYDAAAYYLREAFRNGFTDTVSLAGDTRLREFANSSDYQLAKSELLALKGAAAPNSLFHLFVSAFPVVKSPFEILPENTGMDDYEKPLSYEFAAFVPEMENSSFGRDVSNEFLVVANLGENPAYTTLLYASRNYFGGEMQPVYNMLVTYSPKGDIIDSKVFSAQVSAQRIKAGLYDNGKITISDYERVWEQPIDKVAVENNTVKEYKKLATAIFNIDDSGKILEVSVPENYNDSAIVKH